MSSVTVRAEITISIHVGTWNDKTSMHDVKDQAAREAKNLILRHANELGVTIHGEPKIKLIIAEEER